MTSDETEAGRWTREQVRIDDGADDPVPPISGDAVDAVDDAGETRLAGTTDELPRDAAWNKGQMAIDDGGGQPQPVIDPDVMPESESGPTGRRAGPGGGKQFGNIDDGEDLPG